VAQKCPTYQNAISRQARETFTRKFLDFVLGKEEDYTVENMTFNVFATITLNKREMLSLNN